MARNTTPFVRVGPQLARHGLDADEDGGECGDAPEHPEGDGLGADGPLGLRFDGRGVVDLQLLAPRTSV